MSWGFEDHRNTRLYFTNKNYNLKSIDIFISFLISQQKLLRHYTLLEDIVVLAMRIYL